MRALVIVGAPPAFDVEARVVARQGVMLIEAFVA